MDDQKILKYVAQFKKPTPYFLFSKQQLIDDISFFKNQMPKYTEICYAMKANSEPEVLDTMKNMDISFEVASKYELELLRNIRVNPSKIIFGTSVKPESDIEEFYKYGVKRYACDSKEELSKTSRKAPGSQVIIRVLVKDKSNSIFNLSEKFGAELNECTELVEYAMELKLKPCAISFNVGSQARNEKSWANGIRDIQKVISRLADKNIQIDTINIGGGFPISYDERDKMPRLEDIAESIKNELTKNSQPIKIMAEPGRLLSANCYSLVCSVIAVKRRGKYNWLYLDAGVYNALFEAMAFQGRTKYKILNTAEDNFENIKEYIITGPTGDTIDVINRNARLPDSIKVGDKVIFKSVGAYSFTLASKFNGFPIPATYKLST